MPNWVTNQIKAPASVITAMVSDGERIDFSKVVPFPGTFEWDGVNMAAEEMAEIVLGAPLNDHPLVAALQAANRRNASLAKLSAEAFEQFIQMLRNHRLCGFLHSMDFARSAWGTKWNACESSFDLEAGTAEFETAWSCPTPFLVALSKQHPEARIEVTYADEDIGSNCGSFVLVNGQKLDADEAPSWSSLDEAGQARWRAFALKVKGREDDGNDE